MSGDGFNSTFKRLAWWLFIATRGGDMRFRIVKSLKDEPKNANQLSRELNVNYRTIEHHMKILVDNGLVTVQGSGYGKVYFTSQILEQNLDMVAELLKNAENRRGIS